MAAVAFVLGGGGVLGAVQVGMLRALFRAGIRPDLVIGNSVGAVNGALVAADPSEAVTERLVRLWASHEAKEVYGDSLPRQVRRFVARTHLHSPEPLRRLLARTIGAERRFADLKLPFHCCAASIERAAEHWFGPGLPEPVPVVDAVIASSSVPGLLPPARIGEEHFVDGGIVNPVPVGRVVFVAHTGLERMASVADVWRELPMDKKIVMRRWPVPPDEVPAGRQERIDWLYDWWARIDRWIGHNGQSEYST